MSRLLYIEPQPVVRQPLAAILQQQGYTVDQAASAEEGLGLASVCRPDLIITELALPGASGLKFLQAVRKAPGLARTPVLILSSVTDRPTILKAVGFSISGYLLKGAFSLSQFLQQVSLSLRKQPGSPRSAPAAPPPGAGEAGGRPRPRPRRRRPCAPGAVSRANCWRGSARS
jgi:DNA-binding NarL/FixJ family response regulator